MEKNDVKRIDTSRIDKMRWVTVLLQMLVGSAMAYVYCLSVYVGPLSTEYGWDPSVIVIAYSAMMFLGLPGSVVGGKLKEKFGNKTVMKVGGLLFALFVIASSFSTGPWGFVILFGVCASFFMYVVYVVQLANIGELFPDKRGLAMGITIAGITVGSALISPLSEYLCRIMDTLHTVALQGAVYGAFVIIAGFLICDAPKGYRPTGWRPKEMEGLDETIIEGDNDISWRRALKMKGFWLYFLGSTAGACFMTGYQGNAVLITQDAIGCTSAQAAWLYSFWLVVLGAAGMVLGFVSDKWTGPIKTQAVFYMVTALALILYKVTGSDDMWAFVVVIFCFALAAGSTQALMPTFTMDLFGSKHYGIIFGFFLFAPSLGGLVGPQLTTRFPADTFLTLGILLELVCAIFYIFTAVAINKDMGRKMF